MEALHRLERAAGLTPDRDRRAERLVAAGRVAFELGRPDVATGLLAAADRDVTDPGRRSEAHGLAARFHGRLHLGPESAGSRRHDLVTAAHAVFWRGATTGERARLAAGLAHVPPELRGAEHVAALSAVDPAAAARPLRELLHGVAQDPRTLRLLGFAAINTGDPVGATDLLSRAVPDLRASGRLGLLTQRLAPVTATAHLARAVALFSADRWGEGHEAVRRLLVPGDPAYHPQHVPEAITFWAESAAIGGGSPAAAVLPVGVRETPAGRIARTVAEAMTARPDEAAERFGAARAHDLTRWPWLQARLDLAHGSWLRRAHRSEEAREPLRAAQARFDLLPAPAWAARAGRELRAAGADPGLPADPGVSETLLSAQELVIARLAAEGHTNREIGRRLFLSPRTVGSHLYRVFPKLGITSRGQLAARLPPS